jgi:hypothetical protein
VAYPTVSVVFFGKLAVVEVDEGRVALHPFLLAQIVVLSLGAVHRSVCDLKGTINKITTD